MRERVQSARTRSAPGLSITANAAADRRREHSRPLIVVSAGLLPAVLRQVSSRIVLRLPPGPRRVVSAFKPPSEVEQRRCRCTIRSPPDGDEPVQPFERRERGIVAHVDAYRSQGLLGPLNGEPKSSSVVDHEQAARSRRDAAQPADRDQRAVAVDDDVAARPTCMRVQSSSAKPVRRSVLGYQHVAADRRERICSGPE